VTPRHLDSGELIQQVIQGERPCTDLSELGIRIQIVDDKWHIESPPMEAVRLHIADVAHGLVKYAPSPNDLKKWATLMLCGSGFIDFSECETQTGWDLLLNALWDAMGTGTFSNSALHLAEELAK